VYRRLGRETGVDLRDGTKRALPGEAHLVSSLDRFLDPPFDGKTAPEGIFEALPRDGAPGELVRELQTADRRNDDRLYSVPDLHLDVAVRIRELLDADGRLALSTDVDERHLRPDRHDLALARLSLAVELRRERFLQHACEVLRFLGAISRRRRAGLRGGGIGPRAVGGIVLVGHFGAPHGDRYFTGAWRAPFCRVGSKTGAVG
jgi:hypothetical protein